jgi:hypothetical protein
MGPNPAPRKVLAPLDLLPFPRPREAHAPIACLDCSSPLTLHQPDPELADRLLGTCEGCKHWYLVDLVPGGSGGFLVGLPGREVVRELSREDPEDGISLMGGDSAEREAGPKGDG